MLPNQNCSVVSFKWNRDSAIRTSFINSKIYWKLWKNHNILYNSKNA